MSRTSSASRDSDREVKPTRSAKRTDTSRRSASEPGSPAASAATAAGSPSVAPHVSQKVSAEETGCPFGHVSASVAPQARQNLASARLSTPQLEQVTGTLKHQHRPG